MVSVTWCIMAPLFYSATNQPENDEDLKMFISRSLTEKESKPLGVCLPDSDFSSTRHFMMISLAWCSLLWKRLGNNPNLTSNHTPDCCLLTSLKSEHYSCSPVCVSTAKQAVGISVWNITWRLWRVRKKPHERLRGQSDINRQDRKDNTKEKDTSNSGNVPGMFI